ncbi:MAG: alpha-glucan family phosphorylase [Bacteroidales bacterium]|nr:alpha-glucan family phosphorylase [Bacteroidales bacterium]MCB8998620.1 alpha-glucan family phosphorylase [Bacteroidales bacterium]MCB9012512.1 alpha-glucan family phosphorylase [Bacteroidales bacterium]
MTNDRLSPNYIFEVSWEVCNKVGGIHTVISTKALSLQKEFGDKFISIGPDVWREDSEHPEFLEDVNLLSQWKQQAAIEGLRVRIGRWKIKGNPMVILVDFTTLFSKKDEVFSKLWELYKLDSIAGQWDYVEPSLFGYAAGQVIESYCKYHLSPSDKIISQFHEWMTGAGLLYLHDALPQAGTVFTTHATAVGRVIAGNQLPLYSKLKEYNGDVKAGEYNLTSKQSMEKISARFADAFTTVSELTARECAQFLQKEVDILTPNGFEDSFVPSDSGFPAKRKQARKKLLEVASALLGEEYGEDTFLLANSGRYEFKNKGIDVLIDSLGKLKRDDSLKKKVLAFILIPANHYGARKDLVEKMQGGGAEIQGENYLTHNLHYVENDPILGRLKTVGIENQKGDDVKVIFVPSQLNGNDGIFNMSYYELLIGFDLTVFPSYYEPWGYTPLESLAFHIPTITTSLSGFGLWARDNYKDAGNGIFVIERDDFNETDVVEGISNAIRTVANQTPKAVKDTRDKAFDISRIALWSNLIDYYYQAYDTALTKVMERVDFFVEHERVEQLPQLEVNLGATPQWKRVLVQQILPESLQPLDELSKNLWWCWNQEAIELFESIDPKLWKEVAENPLELLERIPFVKLDKLHADKDFLARMNKVHQQFKSYMDEKPKDGPTVAYFSMEFGLHDSLKIYSGGLGLLAGDYLKEASDYNYKIIGIGFLYRYGYFKQLMTVGGEQMAITEPQVFSKTPAQPLFDEKGEFKKIKIVLPGRDLWARIWQVNVGRVKLYLLDTDIDDNQEHDRSITHQLYGGDNENRLKQEILLGIGGIRALRSLGLNPDTYHCNEGHAAFTGLERLREYIQDKNHTYPEALEIVRSSALFTTHTPVPAGHDYFTEDLMRAYIAHYPDRLKINWNQLMNLGKMHPNSGGEKFSMSCLAVNLSQEVNGVSRVHGFVSRDMFADMWAGYLPEEVPIGYVTNGVHIPTWISKSWRELYHRALDADFYKKQEDRSIWAKINEVDQAEIWKIKSEERKKLVEYIKDSIVDHSIKSHEDPKTIVEIQEKLDPNALTIGFARRFATYKRAHLLFMDLERLAAILNNPFMPVQIFFAGKAHPQDKMGQDLIKMIVEISRKPEFMGKILFIPGYEIALAKKLLHGVDIWMNTPTRPLEASGTSGEKAVMNGDLHFSVLDGWWAEGYREGAGWALDEERAYDNQNFQDKLDAETIYSLIENEITPAFYKRDAQGVPTAWVSMIQKSITEVCPEFTMNRQLLDYINQYYEPLYQRTLKMREKDFEMAAIIASWKKKILNAWNDIEIVSITYPQMENQIVCLGNHYYAQLVLDLKTLKAEEIGVELVVAEMDNPNHKPKITEKRDFNLAKKEGSKAWYDIEFSPSSAGIFDFGIRIFPKHKLLAHRQELALLRWI